MGSQRRQGRPRPGALLRPPSKGDRLPYDAHGCHVGASQLPHLLGAPLPLVTCNLNSSKHSGRRPRDSPSRGGSRVPAVPAAGMLPRSAGFIKLLWHESQGRSDRRPSAGRGGGRGLVPGHRSVWLDPRQASRFYPSFALPSSAPPPMSRVMPAAMSRAWLSPPVLGSSPAGDTAEDVVELDGATAVVLVASELDVVGASVLEVVGPSVVDVVVGSSVVDVVVGFSVVDVVVGFSSSTSWSASRSSSVVGSSVVERGRLLGRRVVVGFSSSTWSAPRSSTRGRLLARRRGRRLLGRRRRWSALGRRRGRGCRRRRRLAARHPEHLVLHVGALRPVIVGRQLHVPTLLGVRLEPLQQACSGRRSPRRRDPLRIRRRCCRPRR